MRGILIILIVFVYAESMGEYSRALRPPLKMRKHSTILNHWRWSKLWVIVDFNIQMYYNASSSEKKIDWKILFINYSRCSFQVSSQAISAICSPYMGNCILSSNSKASLSKHCHSDRQWFSSLCQTSVLNYQAGT